MNNDPWLPVDDWVAKANEDWETVGLLISHTRSPNLIICFHCQQYVEKLLKALLTKHRIEFSKTHNLSQLMQQLERVEPRFMLFLDLADELSLYGVRSRYPDNRITISKQDMLRIVKLAEEIGELTTAKLIKFENK
jgi:HEPN domain-containing protein